ncbi:MAG: hypothetical protein N3D72_00445, partial [Candidatus Methanomethyliaceae archaeon]|nr:hypothetical protein [Candidatus Methanomethyliaceae archaeon]
LKEDRISGLPEIAGYRIIDTTEVSFGAYIYRDILYIEKLYLEEKSLPEIILHEIIELSQNGSHSLAEDVARELLTPIYEKYGDLEFGLTIRVLEEMIIFIEDFVFSYFSGDDIIKVRDFLVDISLNPVMSLPIKSLLNSLLILMSFLGHLHKTSEIKEEKRNGIEEALNEINNRIIRFIENIRYIKEKLENSGFEVPRILEEMRSLLEETLSFVSKEPGERLNGERSCCIFSPTEIENLLEEIACYYALERYINEIECLETEEQGVHFVVRLDMEGPSIGWTERLFDRRESAPYIRIEIKLASDKISVVAGRPRRDNGEYYHIIGNYDIAIDNKPKEISILELREALRYIIGDIARRDYGIYITTRIPSRLREAADYINDEMLEIIEGTDRIRESLGGKRAVARLEELFREIIQRSRYPEIMHFESIHKWLAETKGEITLREAEYLQDMFRDRISYAFTRALWIFLLTNEERTNLEQFSVAFYETLRRILHQLIAEIELDLCKGVYPRGEYRRIWCEAVQVLNIVREHIIYLRQQNREKELAMRRNYPGFWLSSGVLMLLRRKLQEEVLIMLPLSDKELISLYSERARICL